MKTDLIKRCHKLANGKVFTLKRLEKVLSSADISDEELRVMTRVDMTKPYGRRVFIDNDNLEGMIARWTPGVPCAPHDHGGSNGAVLVLRGTAKHTVFKLEDGKLTPKRTTNEGKGSILSCGPNLIHTMCSVDPNEPLITLHLYYGPIDHMHVFDMEENQTLIVDGGCGAWIPTDQPEMIRQVLDGMHRMPAA